MAKYRVTYTWTGPAQRFTLRLFTPDGEYVQFLQAIYDHDYANIEFHEVNGHPIPKKWFSLGMSGIHPPSMAVRLNCVLSDFELVEV